MKFLIIFLFITFTLLLSSNHSLMLFNLKQLDTHWSQFKKQHNRTYRNNTHETNRRKIFRETLNKINKQNALFKNGEITYTSDINEFSDWTSDEFMSFINKGLVTSNNTNTSFNLRFFQNETSINTSARIYARIAASVDWRTKGVVNAIKNQGRCGSCWAFSANDILESYSAMITGVVPTLSEQNLVDCTYNYDGCQGGWMTDAFDYVIKNKGIGFGYGYPYSSGISGTVNIFC